MASQLLTLFGATAIGIGFALVIIRPWKSYSVLVLPDWMSPEPPRLCLVPGRHLGSLKPSIDKPTSNEVNQGGHATA